MTPNSGNSGHSGRSGANHGGANHGGSNYSGRPGRDERTEFFRGDDRTEYFGSNERTQYFGSNEQTQYIDRPNINRPRQYFPDQDQNQGPQGQQGQPQTQQYQGPYTQGFGQNQYGQQYGQPYNSGYAPAAQQATVHNAHQPQQTAQASGGSSSWQMLLGIISGLALLLAVVFFFLWRSADNEQATPPTPTTVTSTQTEEVNVTVTEPTTVIEEPVLPGGDGGSWRDQIPTEVPEELLPPEGEEFDLRSWLSNIFG
ncbi:hypothetical protein PQG67_09145 [Corynebacterium pseudodiphtheriticum]|uniref:hypothetical protein n=1 Tax=Corynebacterium pseudodiphtheriticum TaxID=37637 RepID=UPI00234C95AD|nr:hypothetical protein [Corynebacterium pseudodiphtheriticum]MDC7068023.1 hypothetical protein [Corynebacterium pseudodiphtheriticum]MDC7083909.1 hypothetical protein [Corynebacterium pseudodiphtheriticum]MDC7087112.1 hypothetical protein [Corynebacterium pseudodiphtheriticum]